tara:strand:+ start:144042 stop:145550 length:1509 start_codon:yes stop_codon:yes gene_type:complete
MDTQLLDKILNCPSLPSLPAVAIRVLELTSDPDVKMDQLAKEIQIDQGIAAKILRTVNSSFYGLRKRCSSIEQALIMLGLVPVKSLVLGFSLVSSVDGVENDEFNYVSYWERGLTTAVGAKFAAELTKNRDIIDEAFLSGLFQDIGMVAMHRTIGEEYLAAIKSTEGVHTKLSKIELDSFEMEHAVVGAMMCENWKIPHEIVIPVRYHDRPTACPKEFAQITRCVALGNMIHDVLKSDDPTESLRQAYAKGASWLGFTNEQIDELITKTSETTKELGNVFSIDVSSMPNPEEVLAKADRQLIELSKNQQIESLAAKQFADLIQGDDGTDPFTGALLREGFTIAARKAFEDAHAGMYSLSIVQLLIDGYDELGTSIGTSAQDEVVIGTSVLLRRHFEPMGGVICRLSDSVFAVILPSITRAEASNEADACCREFIERLPSWVPDSEGIETSVQLALGVATLDDETRPMIKSADLLVKAASQAVLAAKAHQGSAVRVFIPRAAA